MTQIHSVRDFDSRVTFARSQSVTDLTSPRQGEAGLVTDARAWGEVGPVTQRKCCMQSELQGGEPV
eukprot:353037-Chlamydomonas_euryale.AAC.9